MKGLEKVGNDVSWRQDGENRPGREKWSRMKTILIVDDNPTNLKLLRAVLEAESFAVVEAADGVEALEVLKEQKVDSIISDILMPRMDGYRLCLEVRKSESHALPFIFYTST